MRGGFQAEGDDYEYVRLAKVLDRAVRAAQHAAGLQPTPSAQPLVPLGRPLRDGWQTVGRYLQIDRSLSYIEDHRPDQGETGTIIALHTAGQSGVQYRRAAPELARLGYRVLIPDFPGHGRSEPAVTGPVTDLGYYAQWCVDVLDRLEVDQVYIVGCSIGGKIALDLAHRLGHRSLGAIAMAASAGPGHSSRKALLRELSDVGAPSRSDRTYLGTHAVVGRSVAAPVRELIALMHRREDPHVSTSDLLGWNSHDLRPVLGEITCPVRLVGGTDDLWLDLDEVRRTAEALPHADVSVLDGIGHYPHQELADFADRVHDWISTWTRSRDRAGREIAHDRA
ncbi:alpha/beta fold hydrolase [Epidermidibacterium keratini]|uniref:Alpha/beta fold hydrolase n=2 Tax=Epidermidibacterium keratini TaxID=1891644 RepID=A0A7L4YWD0_9ACTN|nr:alpha/beta fold hydrolase [Epidermidibacterium keratini]